MKIASSKYPVHKVHPMAAWLCVALVFGVSDVSHAQKGQNAVFNA
jgi:hypothetical protein